MFSAHQWKIRVKLTVGGHSHRDALLEAAFLALVPGHFINHALALVLARVGWVEVLLDGPSEEPLQRRHRVEKRLCGADGSVSGRCLYLAAFAGNAAIVVAGGFVPAHDT